MFREMKMFVKVLKQRRAREVEGVSFWWKGADEGGKTGIQTLSVAGVGK